MSADCAICLSATSKYKCPTCEIRYCSLACYKTHKPVHASDQPAATAPSPLTLTSTSAPPAAEDDATQPKTQARRKNRKPDFASFESDHVLRDLLRKDPSLRIRLQSVYGLTLEPMRDGGGSRGRGRGGRGGRGGFGRGGGGGGWTQAKGDAEALEKLSSLRHDGGEDGGVAEFIRLVGLRFGNAEQG